MAKEGNLRILRGHAAAVVLHPHKCHAAVLYFHRDGFGAGVDGIFHQLFDYRSWPLHHLAGGNQVCHVGRQLDNFRHTFSPYTASLTISMAAKLMAPCRRIDAQID